MDIEQIADSIARQGFQRRGKILVIDDDKLSLHVITDVLSDGLYDVIPARTGEQAIMISKTLRPDGILTDCDLGGGGGEIDGIDTLYQIQQIYPGENIPMAMRSAHMGMGHYEKKAKEKELNILRWWDAHVSMEEIRAFLDEYVAEPLLRDIRNSIIKKLEKLEEAVTKLDKYESFLGDIDQLRLIGSYEGEVEDIYMPPGVSKEEEEEARIIFWKGNERFVRIFPAERLKEADADFPLAKVRYEIYALAEKNISVLKYIGPSDEELLKETRSRISDEDVEELDRLASAGYARRTEEALNLHKIKEKTHWILGIIDEAAEIFDNEDERFISLAQTRRVLREQVWTLCTGQLQQRRRIITFIINAISRTTAKDVTVDELTSLKKAVSALAEEYIEPARFEQIEDTMLRLGS